MTRKSDSPKLFLWEMSEAFAFLFFAFFPAAMYNNKKFYAGGTYVTRSRKKEPQLPRL